jgi:hypothetical protein
MKRGFLTGGKAKKILDAAQKEGSQARMPGLDFHLN